MTDNQELEAPTKMDSLDFSTSNNPHDLVTLKVGPQKHPITIPKSLLSASSLVFKTHLKPEWQRNKNENTIEIEIEEPQTIQLLVSWIETKNIRIPSTIENRQTMNGSAGAIVKLFIAADTYDVPALQNDCINALFLLLDPISGILPRPIDLEEIVNFVYDRTLAGSQLRKLMLRIIGSQYKSKDFKERMDFFCEEFKGEMVVGLMEEVEVCERRFGHLHGSSDGSFCGGYHNHHCDDEDGCPWPRHFHMFDEEGNTYDIWGMDICEDSDLHSGAGVDGSGCWTVISAYKVATRRAMDGGGDDLVLSTRSWTTGNVSETQE